MLKGLSVENIKAPTTSDYSLSPKISYLGNTARVEYKGSYLRQDKITCNQEKIVNIYIIYERTKNFSISTYPIIENCLFGAVCLTKNVDFDKFK